MMKFPKLFVSAMVIAYLSTTSVAYPAERYVVDTEQSFIRIAAKMCQPDILKGDFVDVTGEVLLDEEDLEKSSVKLIVNTGSAVYDHEYHLSDNINDIVSSDKILNVLRFPLATFQSTEVKQLNSQEFEFYGKQSSVITASVKGNLTLVGMTHPMEMEITFHNRQGMTSEGREVAAFSAWGTILRSNFGVNYGNDRVGIRKMGNEVMVMASITANRAK